MRRTRKNASETPIDPADLAAGYMFPELFADAPFTLRSEEVTERPFVPSAAVQFKLPDMPAVDWEHVRAKQRKAEQDRRRRRRRANPPPIIIEDPQP